MGTNYYLHEKPDCECCGRPFAALHIGKSSGGWCFSLHVMPEDMINTLDDWRSKWSKLESVIRDEYDAIISPEEMEDIITNRSSALDFAKLGNSAYNSGEAFHRRNQSERGPNNLLRHQINSHCIGHGEGTFDYIVGEFS